jgi:coenzyme PQQ synthesis protein D (PqqD)
VTVRWRRGAGVLWRTAPGYLVLGTVDGRVIEVEGPGGEVWELLKEWMDEGEVTATLAGRYRADREVVERDVGSLLSELAAQGFLERRD